MPPPTGWLPLCHVLIHCPFLSSAATELNVQGARWCQPGSLLKALGSILQGWLLWMGAKRETLLSVRPCSLSLVLGREALGSLEEPVFHTSLEALMLVEVPGGKQGSLC